MKQRLQSVQVGGQVAVEAEQLCQYAIVLGAFRYQRCQADGKSFVAVADKQGARFQVAFMGMDNAGGDGVL